MKIGTIVCLIMVCTLCLGISISSAQTTGDFRTHSVLLNGNWSSPASWDRYNGSVWINPAPNGPTGSETIYIGHSDSVSIDVPVTITGTINDSGRVNIGTGSLTIGNHGVYNSARDTSRIPTATWATGSTCIVTGVAAVAPSNANQNYYNFVWNCANQTGNLNPGFNGNTISGNVTCSAAGASGRLQFTAPQSDSTRMVTILGNIYVNGTGSLTAQGTSNVRSTTIVNVYGNIIATAGNFSIARGSQGGTGTTIWNFYGDTLLLSNCVTNNSNANGARIVFTKVGVQTAVLSNVNWGGGTTAALNMTVDSGSVLNLDTTVIPAANTGSLRLLAGAGLICGDPAGINGNVLCTGGSGGGNLFGKSALYAFKSASAQTTGALLPDTVGGLSLLGSAGTTVSNPVVVNGTLELGGNGSYTNLSTVTGNTGVIYSATTPQTTGSELASTTTNLTIKNSNGVTLSGNTLVNGTLSLSAGVLSTGTNTLEIGSTGKVSRSSGYVLGNLKKTYSAAGPDTFQVGTANGYSPVMINVTTGSGNVTVKAIQGVHPNVTNSQKTLARYWTLTGGTGITAASLTFQYLAGDVNGNEAIYVAGLYGGTNFGIHTTTVNSTNHTATATGVTSLAGDWSMGEELALSVKSPTEDQIPKSFFVKQNYPNPFNPTTNITYGLPKNSRVYVKIYSILGQEVATLFAGEQTAGVHTVKFNASSLSSGIYLYRVQAGNTVDVKRMVLLK
jgi:hypothetical protein